MKAREIVRQAGYNARPVDYERGFKWDYALVDYIASHDKPTPHWDNVMAERPSLLRFWYRQSDYPMTAVMFHDDLLTPGIIQRDDPPPVLSGMLHLELDAAGRLLSFEAIPPQVQEPAANPPEAPDWGTLFSAAALNPADFQPVEPRRTWLGTSDTRAAWTGTWPGTSRPLRVEAATLLGKPVAFALIGPWEKPWRMPSSSTVRDDFSGIIYGLLALAAGLAAALLARRNLSAGRGDRRGAFRLAVFVFAVQMILWATRTHLTPSFALMGLLMIALCTSAFYGLVMWTIYLALEPIVRRYWPRTLIAWTRILVGQIRDPVVGRDALVGAALGVSWALIGRTLDLFIEGVGAVPTWTSTDLLLGTRSAIAAWMTRGPHRVRDALFFFCILFLARVLLRKQWLAAAAFVLLFTLPQVLGSSNKVLEGMGSAIIYGLAAFVVIRFGLLALTAGLLVGGLIGSPPTLHLSAWYFGNIAFLHLTALALATWAFYAATRGRRLWSSELFG